MELKLLVILYLTTLPLNILCIAIDKNNDSQNSTKIETQKYNEKETYEKKPDPSPLIIPGYNLPGSIFNNGKPFYVDKDPVTGVIDFNSKTPAGKQSYLNEYDYIDEEPSTNIFDKANIDRKDGNFGSHRPNDINQLTPNFHDFLNLPVKYNPDKYVYPLISSSYANTKIQGNVNSYNHKQYSVTTFKPTVSPTYYTTKSAVYFSKQKETTDKPVKVTSTTTTIKPTTTATSTTTKMVNNLLNSAMKHPYYSTEESDYDYDYVTTKAPQNLPKVVTKIEVKPTTTQKPYSIFDELFGDYEESKPMKPPSLFSNLPSMNFDNKYNKPEKEYKETTTTASIVKQNDTKGSNMVANSGTYNKQEPEYDYDDYVLEDSLESVNKTSIIPQEVKTTTQAVTYGTTTKKPEVVQTVFSNFHQNYKPVYEPEYQNSYSNQNKTVNITTQKPNEYISITSSENYDDYEDEEITKSSTKYVSFTETPPTMRVTSLPLGENHPNARLPIISMSNQILKEQLNNERVDMTIKTTEKTVVHPAPSTSNIHIAPDQDMVSFVVGNQQNVGGVQFNAQAPKETFISNSFRPLYTPPKQVQHDQVVQNNGEVKETLTFTGTGQTNSNYSWTVPTQNKYEPIYPNNFNSPPSNIYNQEIQSNYSWTVPETKYVAEQPIKYNPSKTNSLYNGGSPVDYNLQQVNAGYSVGQPVQSSGNYGQGAVFNVGISNGANIKYKVPNYQYAQVGTNYNLTVFPEASSSINIQPLRGAEASLSIGTPTNEVKTIPGQVVDEKLDLKDTEEYNKPSNKIVFPDDTYTSPSPNKEILSLYSKPMFHQLPADLTPPSEQEVKPAVRPGNVRPPWDPRPGHFYQGRPEYARPPRPPHKPEIYKRIDGLPNILPQFRPNAKGHYHDNIPINPGYMQRQPLLERPSNRPIAFFEKLQPPPLPKRILELRKPVTLNQHLIQNDMKHSPENGQKQQQNNQNYKPNEQQFNNYPNPPTVPVANRRNGEEESEIATLQMIHAKQTDKLNSIKPNMPPPFKINYKETTDKPLYVVYPVNSSPLKLDVLDNDNRETVVIGTRGEQPLPPSKIRQEIYTEKPILKPKDAPILKPQSRPTNPIKTDFPYPLERPDPTALYNVPDVTTNTGNNLENIDYPKKYYSNNQWPALETESRIINANKINYANEPISATLKTQIYTPSPIAIAYTPTEPAEPNKYSLPNYGSAVISEIRDERPAEVVNGQSHRHGIVTNAGSEFTVSAVMHTHTQNNMMLGNTVRKGQEKLDNHKIDTEVDQYPPKLDFQAPFQASVNVGSQNNGWSVVRDKPKGEDRSDNDVTTIESETSSKFDIENFTPEMLSGFKPIFEFHDDKKTEMDSELSERK